MTSPVQSGPGACVTSFSGYFTKKNPAGLIILRVLQSNLKLMTAFYMATTSNLFYSAKTSTRAQTAPLFLLRPRSRPHIHPYYYRSFCNVGKHARMSRSVTHRRRLRLRRVRGLRVRSSARTSNKATTGVLRAREVPRGQLKPPNKHIFCTVQDSSNAT